MRAPIALVLLVAAVTGCSGAATTGGGFDLNEWAIAGPMELTSDADAVNVTNSGALPHTLVVTDASGRVVAATDLVQPGESTELTIDLEAGRYSFTCRIVAQNAEGEIVDHFEAGMNKTVSVSG